MTTPVPVTDKSVDAVIEEIRVAMTRRRCNQRDLAKRLGVNEQWVSRRFTKAVDISVGELFRIAAALDVNPRTLLPEVDVTVQYPDRHIATIGRPFGARRPIRLRPAVPLPTAA